MHVVMRYTVFNGYGLSMISMTARELRDVALWNFRNLSTTFK